MQSSYKGHILINNISSLETVDPFTRSKVAATMERVRL